MSRQDRQGARTPAGLEQKYNFGGVFSRLGAENAQQNLTMKQFAELMTETIATIQKDIKGLNDSVKTLSDKDTEIEQEMEKSETALDNKIDAYWKTIYPVGSIYVSVSSNSPATLFGGTWTQIKDTFLLASGSTYAAGSTGGEATHELTVDEMPSHNHNTSINVYSSSGENTEWVRETVQKTYTEQSFPSTSTGGGKAHNNMPPYLAVYVWKRTA